MRSNLIQHQKDRRKDAPEKVGMMATSSPTNNASTLACQAARVTPQVPNLSNRYRFPKPPLVLRNTGSTPASANATQIHFPKSETSDPQENVTIPP